jgi:oxygen-dependent protoporphyrinogen oxidase
MQKSKKNIVVVGGGIAGTSAAHELTRLGYKVTIVEKRNRLGGRVHSHLINGAAVEMGAGFLTKEYKNLWGFLERISLDSSLYRQKSKTGVYVDKKVYMLTLRTLLANKPLALSSKLHAVSLIMKTFMNWRKLDLHNFWGASDLDDRSVAMMYRSKSGIDFMEKALQPVLNGYFYWSPEHTSEAMILILSRAAFSHGTYRLKGGLQQIPEAAAQESNVLLGHSVSTITKSPDGAYIVNCVAGAKTRFISADAIICATTASVVTRIFPNLTDRQRAFFEAVKYSSAALVQNASKEESVNDKSIAFLQTRRRSSSATGSTEQGEDGAHLLQKHMHRCGRER